MTIAKRKQQQTMTVARLMAGLKKHDGGVLKTGCHGEGERKFCALEFSSMMRGKGVDDNPGDLPDFRSLNDADQWRSDKERTRHLLPVMAALWDWRTWSTKRQNRFTTLFSGDVQYNNYRMQGYLHQAMKDGITPITLCERLIQAAHDSLL